MCRCGLTMTMPLEVDHLDDFSSLTCLPGIYGSDDFLVWLGALTLDRIIEFRPGDFTSAANLLDSGLSSGQHSPPRNQ
jgi:hypothetical protein